MSEENENLGHEEIISRVYEMLFRQKFADWYSKGNFDKFITGDMEYETKKSHEECKKEVRNDIRRFLALDD